MKTITGKPMYAFLAVLFLSASLCAGSPMTLWGKQKMGFGGKNASFDGNTLVLKKSATVKKASGNAGTFSIWSGGRSILTVHSMKDIIGKTLQPGKYVIRPGLSKGQSEATVTLTLE